MDFPEGFGQPGPRELLASKNEKPDNRVQTSCDDVCTLLPGRFLLNARERLYHSTAARQTK